MVAAFDLRPNLDSGHCCAHCGEPILLLDEAVLLEVAFVAKTDCVEYFTVEDENGNYAYEPYFFHHRCWEEDVENVLCEYVEEETPVLDGRGVAECEGCTSDILPWETSGVLHLGEFQRSERDPDGEFRIKFVQYETQKSRPLCIACLALINEDILEMWEGGITHRGACPQGVQIRCWRNGACDDPGQEGCRLFSWD